MKRIKELKKQLGNRYSFKKYLREKEIARLQKENPSPLPETVAAVLTAGCLKLQAVLYRAGGRLQLGYDVFVKDDKDTPEWICYDALNVPVSLKEADMLAVLVRIAETNHLSYTKSCFVRLDGKTISPKEKPQGNPL